MRIFVVEYITGGGLAGEPISAGLLNDADIMLCALLDDLSALAGVRLLVSRDPRLPALAGGADVFTPVPHDDVWEAWGRCIQRCDAVWAIMPETGGCLRRISLMALVHGRLLIGSRPAAVAIASSKLLTAQSLQKAGIDAVPTYRVADGVPRGHSRWVLKPDDGAGCDGTCIFADYAAMSRARPGHGYVAQPLLEGTAASLSMLCCDGAAVLLTANLQYVRENGRRFEPEGVLVNGLAGTHARYARLARLVALAIPGLWGYVGVDMVLTAHGPVVLEVNPRLTVSYAGLRSALGVNPAGMILRMLRTGVTPPPCVPLAGASYRVLPGLRRVA